MDKVESIFVNVRGLLSRTFDPRLPVEVCERIIDHIAVGWKKGYFITKGEPYLSTLASCALVCQDWYYLTWYHLRQRVYLRDRKDVLSLSKTLSAKPRLREVIEQVIISGSSPGKRRPIRHLGTFAAMFAGKAPKLWWIIIEDAEWTIGSLRIKDIGYLVAFRSIDTLKIHNITLSNVTQLSHLVLALPRLRDLLCIKVDCLQKQHVSPVSLPLNCANLEDLDVRWVAPAVEDLCVQISRASRVRDLGLAVDDELDPSSVASRSQPLLDASSTSAETIQFHFDPSSPVPDERHYNLSHHDNLRRLEIYLYPPFVAWSWIPHILSHIVSKHFKAMCVVLAFQTDQMTDVLDGMLTTMEQDGVLARLDSILQEKRFSGTIASRGVCIGVNSDKDTWTTGSEFVGMGSAAALQEQYDRLDGLVKRKMPHSRGRGILSNVHDFQEFVSWRQDMEEIHHQSMQAEQKNTTGEDAHPGADGPRGSTD
ncbi:uncharacterized protein B0H18DRAFT_1208961 [Fomitopsis serialis]|uniref:uncharacterized protein n=1 Tax=Fomitopsis serialis TaxID=139415 RepID=UPI0020079D10|nr:uncharacterized protein B0H18DRAFT_1208961 [Neoantrodia serialis]KAH9931280.1 hypothetical protein B0H18DRAFT_1208961 [Neoantrodia serialis]